MTDDGHDVFEVEHAVPGGVHGRRVRSDGTEQEGTLLVKQPGTEILPGEELLVAKATGPRSLKLRAFYTHKGPARASSPVYRDHYDAIFGPRKLHKELN